MTTTGEILQFLTAIWPDVYRLCMAYILVAGSYNFLLCYLTARGVKVPR